MNYRADRSDDGAVVSCRVDHESLNSTPQIAMQVLEIHCKYYVSEFYEWWTSVNILYVLRFYSLFGVLDITFSFYSYNFKNYLKYV